MSHEIEEFRDDDDYHEERPRDSKIDEAKALLRRELFATEPDAVFYQRQIETRFEASFFHWITAKALGELVSEGHLQSVLEQLVGGTRIRFYWLPRNRYWRRRANAIKKVVLQFTDAGVGHAIGRQGEQMFDAALPRIGMMPVPPIRNVREFGGNVWTETRHDLDRVFSMDGVDYGVEIKNTLSYIDRSELEIKLKICDALKLRPLFIMRMAPKSYVHQIYKRGGYSLIFGKQYYPFGLEKLAELVRRELALPVECIRDVPEGNLSRFRAWHEQKFR